MVTTTNLVAYYKLDESSGTFTDSHASYDLTNTGVAYSGTGKINTAGTWGSNTSDKLSATLTTGTLAFNFWVDIDSLQTNGTFFSINDGTNELAMQESGGNLKLMYWDGTSSNIDMGSYATFTGSYAMISITHDGTDYKAWINGVQKGSAMTKGSPFTSAPTLRIGNHAYLSRAIEGNIDEFAAFTSLSSSDVSDLYASGSGLAYPFVSDVTKVVSALTLSTTDEYPTLITTVPGGSLSLTASLIAPMPIVPLPLQNTVGTTLINKNYPNVEGLIAGTTKQTGNPNLVAIEGDRSW